jgi:hypothetical protein
MYETNGHCREREYSLKSVLPAARHVAGATSASGTLALQSYARKDWRSLTNLTPLNCPFVGVAIRLLSIKHIFVSTKYALFKLKNESTCTKDVHRIKIMRKVGLK